MLSHVHDERFFSRGSNDLIFSSSQLKDQSKSKLRASSSSSITKRIKKTKKRNTCSISSDVIDSNSDSVSSSDGSSADIEDQEEQEDDILFSQVQPYYRSSQLRAMAAKHSSPLRRPRDYRPEKISLVYLPTGEIRPKDTMVPRLLAHDTSSAYQQNLLVGSTEEYQAEEEEEEEEEEEKEEEEKQEQLQRSSRSPLRKSGNRTSTSPNPMKNSRLSSSSRSPSTTKTTKQKLSSSQMQVTELKRSRIKTPTRILSPSPASSKEKTLPSRLELLEKQISKEKERLLSKMTQILEEQEKNQRLQQEKQDLEQSLTKQKKHFDRQVQLEKETHAKLQEQIQVKEAIQIHMESEMKQWKSTCQIYQQEMDELIDQMTFFCQTIHHTLKAKKTTPPTFDTKWAFKYPRLKQAHEQLEATFKQHLEDHFKHPSIGNKKTEHLELELEQLHAKYVELKELCARQCVREADLQNFVNEHRLKGNLVIPASSTSLQQAEELELEEEAERPRVLLKRTTPRHLSHRHHMIKENVVEDSPAEVYEVIAASGTSSAVLKKLEQEQQKATGTLQKTSTNSQKIERIKLFPSSKLSKQYERIPTPKAGVNSTGTRSSVTRATTVSSRANDIREFATKNAKSSSRVALGSTRLAASSTRPTASTSTAAMSRSRVASKTTTSASTARRSGPSASSSRTTTKTSLLRPWS